MTTRHKELVAGKEKKGVPPIGSSTPAERWRSLRPSTPPGTTVAKDHGKAPATSSTTGVPQKRVPNYLKPTISSNPDAAKNNAIKKLAHDDTKKPTPTMMRRRSFDRPVLPSPVQRGVQSSGARGGRTTPPFTPKPSTVGTRPSSSSSERMSKVVKAVKSQASLLTTKSMPRTSSSSGTKKDVKTSNLLKASPSTDQEPVHYAPNNIEPEPEEQESLDLNVEEELAKLESPVDLPPEKQFAEDKEHIDEETDSPIEVVDENKETINSIETDVLEDRQDEHDHTPEPVSKNTENVQLAHEEIHVAHENHEPVSENTENVELAHEEIQVAHESEHTDESDQQGIQAVTEGPTDDGDTKEEEKETIEEIKHVELTVSTTQDEKDEEVVEDKQGQQGTEGTDDKEIQKEPVPKIDEEEKPTDSKAANVVHKRQVGPRNKKESPAYNDVIEETTSKLVGKRINRVRALAGAFETVISLQQPDSS